jgi:hypothetical protein
MFTINVLHFIKVNDSMDYKNERYCIWLPLKVGKGVGWMGPAGSSLYYQGSFFTSLELLIKEKRRLCCKMNHPRGNVYR